MRRVLRALVVLQVLLPLCAAAADEKVLIELNSIESADNRCRLNFVVENKSRVAIESMKLDLVGFGGDPQHDWAYLLGQFGALQYDTRIANGLRVVALICLLVSLVYGIWLCMNMRRTTEPLDELGTGGRTSPP